MRENFHLDDFFHIASKIIVVIPVIIVIAALILKFNQKESYSQKTTFLSKNTPIKIIPSVTPAVKFDLIGPLICQIGDDQSSISAYIKDKKIFVSKEEKNKVNYFLINNDCLYMWEKGKYSGEKFCGIASYLSYLENFSIFGFMGMTNLDLASIIANCKKEEFKDGRIFEVPKSVLFKNKNF